MVRPAWLEPFDEIPQLPPRLRIEARGRLVEEQKIRIAHQGASQRQPLFLPARKIPHPRWRFLLELHQGDDLLRRRASGEEAAEQAHGFVHRELFGKLRLLELDAQALAELRRVGRPVQTQNLDLAGIGRGKALADLDGSGLAGAVGTEETETFRRLHFEVQAVDRDHVFVRLTKMAHAQCAIPPGHNEQYSGLVGDLRRALTTAH